MTFAEIVSSIQMDLNLSSTTSATRIGGWVNRGYKQLCTDPMLGIDTVGEVLGVQVSTVIGNRQLTWSAVTTTPSTSVERILRIYDPSSSPPRPVFEVSVDEIQNSILSGDPVQRWARLASGSASETILMDVVPASVYPLQADVLSNQVTLSGTDVPTIPEDYHDTLVYFGKWQELKKMKDYAGAQQEQGAYDKRVTELRLFLALSMHRKVYSGKNQESGTIISARI